jgi:hypothetical protein
MTREEYIESLQQMNPTPICSKKAAKRLAGIED